MPRALDLVVDALATYRLARFVVHEDAPPAVAVRNLVHRHAPEEWAIAVDCAHCTGMWIALAAGVARHLPGWRLLAWPLAVAGAASLLEQNLGEAAHAEAEHQGPVMPWSRPDADPIADMQDMARPPTAHQQRRAPGPDHPGVCAHPPRD